MDFRILGPLEVLDDGRPLPLGRLKERIVLAVLLLHANEFVSRERLIDEIWGVSPPATATKALNVYVSKLRKTLAGNGRDPIATADGGYRLVVDPETVDAERLRVLVARAHECMAAGDSPAASRLFEDALALWRGPTLAGLPLESFARDEVAQLDELRLTALIDRIDCDLAQGRHERVLGELQILVREHPLRERLRAQQMLALYRAERQADALDAYAEARQTLVDDLGIEPSEALQRLQQAILRHDPSLETPAGTAAVNGFPSGAAAMPPTPTTDVRVGEGPAWRRHRPRRPNLPLPVVRSLPRPRSRKLAFAVLLVLVASAAVATILSTSSARATPPALPNSLVRLDPRNGKVASVARTGPNPGDNGGISVTPTAVWTANSNGSISRYDLRTHRVETRGGLPYLPNDPVDHVVADTNGNAWFTSELPTVTRLTPGVGGTSAPLHSLKAETIHVPGPAVGYETLGGGYLWTVVGPYTIPGEDDRLSLIDPVSNQVVDSVRLGHPTTALAFGDGTAWVGAAGADNGPSIGASWLYAIRSDVDAVAQPALDRHPLRLLLDTGDHWGPIGIAVGEGGVWVLTCGICLLGAKPYTEHQMLLKIDPDTLHVLKRIPLDRETGWLAVGAGAVWLTAAKDRFVWQLDPTTGRVLRAIPLRKKGAETCGMTATSNAVWVTIGEVNNC